MLIKHSASMQAPALKPVARFNSVFAPFEGTQRNRPSRPPTKDAKYHGLESANLDCTKDARACPFAKSQKPADNSPCRAKTKANNNVVHQVISALIVQASRTKLPTKNGLARPTSRTVSCQKYRQLRTQPTPISSVSVANETGTTPLKSPKRRWTNRRNRD